MPVILRACAVIAMAVVVTACSAPPSGPLLTVSFHGGLCADGTACSLVYVIERDGRVHGATKPPNDLGTVPTVQLTTLMFAINSTDFGAMRRHPFTGQCPTAHDGPEAIFEFGTPNGVQRIATCEVAVDYGAPLFVAVSAALDPFVDISPT